MGRAKPNARPVMDPADVGVFTMGSASSPRTGNRRRLSRALDSRSMAITVTHGPTGIVLRGEIPEGHHSKDEMRKLKDVVVERLMRELEQAVARHLRAPGRFER
jgi:hypothetical protein